MGKRKLLTALATALVLCLFAVGAMAADVSSFTDLKANLEAGTSVKLTADIATAAFNSTIVINGKKNVTLDLNGYDISAACSAVPELKYMFHLKNGASLTVKGSGTIADTNGSKEGYQVFRVEGGSVLTVENGVQVESATGLCVFVFGNGSTVNISGKMTSNDPAWAAVSGNGNDGYGGTVINVKPGAEIENTSGTEAVAVYHPQEGALNVSGGTIKGTTGIELRSGNLNVTGGTIISIGELKREPGTNGSGSTTQGAAVAVVQHSTNHKINVTISGGKLEARNDKGGSLVEYTKDGDGKKISMEVTGGEFTGTLESEHVTGFVSGGTFSQGVNPVYIANGWHLENQGGKWVVKVIPIASLPETGDASSLMLWVSVLALAAAGFVLSRRARFN